MLLPSFVCLAVLSLAAATANIPIHVLDLTVEGQGAQIIESMRGRLLLDKLEDVRVGSCWELESEHGAFVERLHANKIFKDFSTMKIVRDSDAIMETRREDLGEKQGKVLNNVIHTVLLVPNFDIKRAAFTLSMNFVYAPPRLQLS